MQGLLETQPDFKIVAQAGNGGQLVKAVGETSPQVVIIEVMMKEFDGIKAIRDIIANNPGVKVIVLSKSDNRRLIIGALTAGASGYLLKDCSFIELAEAVRIIARGGTCLSPRVSDVVVEEHFHNAKYGSGSRYETLSQREKQVFKLLVEGQSSRTIADTCGINPKTVESHRLRLMKKLNISSIPELVRYAIREGLCCLED